MKTKKIVLGVLVAGVAAGLAARFAYKWARRNKHQIHERLDLIADEGYETAHDILFPGKISRKKDLRYGPILPL